MEVVLAFLFYGILFNAKVIILDEQSYYLNNSSTLNP